MKTKYLALIILISFSSCARSQKSVNEECKELTDDFEKATQSYLVNCMKSCFRVTFVNAKNPGEKEKFKNDCEVVCRDTIPYDQLNSFKKHLDVNYNCGFDYSKRFANPLPKNNAE